MSRENKFDLRNVERNLKRGKITQEEYDAHLASLEDCSDMMAECETRFMHKSKTEAENQEGQEEQE